MNEQEKSQETVDQKPSPKKKKRCFLAAILPWKGDRFGEGLRKTILLIEQNASVALSIADRGYVMETGNITLQGTGQELLVNPEVKKAYLGA